MPRALSFLLAHAPRPPFIAFGLVGLAVAVSEPFALPALLPSGGRLLGLAPLCLGLLLGASALLGFHRRGTSHDPHAQPTALVTGGPYRFTRNPMYLGVTLVLLGVAFLRAAWPYALVPPLFLWAVRSAFVPREEARLEAAFGEAYAAYKRRVRRWI